MEKKRRRAGVLASALALIVNGSACSGDLTPPTTIILTATVSTVTTPEPTLAAATVTPAYEELSVKGGSYDGYGREHFRVNDPVQIQDALDLVGRWMETVNAAQQVGSTVSAADLAEQLRPLMDSVPADLLDEMSDQSEDIARQRKSLCANRDDFAAGIVAQRELNQNVWLPQEEGGTEITGPLTLDMGVAQGWDMIRASDGAWYSEYLRLVAPARSWYRSPQRTSEVTGTAVFSAGLRFREGEWRVAWATDRCGDLDALGGLYLFITGDATEETSTPPIPVSTRMPPYMGYVPANAKDADDVISSAQAVLDILTFRDQAPTSVAAIESQLREHMLPEAPEGLCGLPQLRGVIREQLEEGTYIRLTQDGPYEWAAVAFEADGLIPEYSPLLGEWISISTIESVRWEGSAQRVDYSSGEVIQQGLASLYLAFDVRLVGTSWKVSSASYCDIDQFLQYGN